MRFRILTVVAAGAMVLPLAACQTAGAPKVVVKEVSIPVVRPCIPAEVPPAPAAYADDGVEMAADPVERMQRRAAANLQRKARLAILEPVVAACR